MAKTFMSSKFHVESTTKIQEKKRILHPLLQEIIKEIQYVCSTPAEEVIFYIWRKKTLSRDFVISHELFLHFADEIA